MGCKPSLLLCQQVENSTNSRVDNMSKISPEISKKIKQDALDLAKQEAQQATNTALAAAARSLPSPPSLAEGQRLDNDLRSISSQLKDHSDTLAQTGNLDALGGTWKSVQLLRGQIGERALRSTSSFFAVVSSAGNTTVLKSLGLAGASNAYATSTTSSSSAVFKPKLYLEIIMSLLDSVNRLLEDESRVLVAAEVAKLATLLVMALVAYKQLREFLDTVGKLGATNMSSGPLENEMDAETVSSIETAVKELLRKTSACKSGASPTNGLLLELSLSVLWSLLYLSSRLGGSLFLLWDTESSSSLP